MMRFESTNNKIWDLSWEDKESLQDGMMAQATLEEK